MPASSAFRGARALSLGTLAVHVTVGLVSSLLFVAAFRFRLDYFFDLASLVDAGPVSAELFRWAAMADLLSYYLPVPVIAYALWRSLRARSAVVADLSFVAACGYAVAGGIGAVMLAVVAPSLMDEHAAAGADPALKVVFAAVTTTVYAIWQVLDPLLLAAWWLGAGVLLRGDHRRFAVVVGVLGSTAAVGALLTLVGARLILGALSGVVFVLWMVWAVWLYVLIWRRAEPFDILAVDTSDHA